MSKVVYILKNDIHCTLCTYFYCNFSMLYAAERLGYKAYIHWVKGLFLQSYEDDAKFDELPNAYSWYFKQPHIENPPPINECEVWTWETANWGTTMAAECYQFMSQPLSGIKDFYKKNLHFNDETNRRGQLLVDKYGIDFSKTIGITWRGTDVYLDGRPRVPIEVYFPFIDEILEKEPDLRIAATAEEETILDPLFKRYPSAFKIEEFISSPYQSKQNPERLGNIRGYEKGLQPALMVWLFSKCKYYIKNRSSTGAVASWLSDGKIINIFHPETLGFPANTNTIEIEGRQYSTENKLVE